MEIDAEKLLAAFKIVDHVPVQQSLPASKFLRLQYTAKQKRITLALSGLSSAEAYTEVTSTASDTTDWTSFVERNLFSAFLPAAQKKIMLQKQEGALLLRSYGNKISIQEQSEPVEGYAASWKEKGFVAAKFPEGTERYLSILAACVAKEQQMQYLSCIVCLKGYGLLATDSFVIAACLDAKTPASFMIPSTVCAIEPESSAILSNATGAAVKFPQGYVFERLAAECEKFPVAKVKSLISESVKAQSMLTLPAKTLAEGLQYLSLFPIDTSMGRVECSRDAKGAVALRMKLEGSGFAERRLGNTKQATLVSLAWPAVKVFPLLVTWLSFLQTQSEDASVSCCATIASSIFRYATKECTYLLTIASMAD